MTGDDEGARLDQFDKVEWLSVCRRIKPDLTQAEFDRLWEENQRKKAERERLARLH